jgi:site-specific DNA recombinase
MARRDRARNPPRELFEAVQTQLAERKVRRKLARSKSSAILMGLIFDDRGHPMSPSHANKKGVRYRYYVSHALLQNRKANAGSIARVSAPDVEALVCNAVKQKERSASQSEGAGLYRAEFQPPPRR